MYPDQTVTADDLLPVANELRMMREMLACWDAMAPGKPRDSISPEEFGAGLLPHLSLGHVLNDGEDVRYDLIGEELEKVAPRLKRGALASDPVRLDPKNRLILDRLRVCAKTREPVAFHAVFDSFDGDPRRVLALLCPLGIDGGDAAASDLLIGVWRCAKTVVLRWESYVDVMPFLREM